MRPQAGAGVIFQHELLHQGKRVLEGVKYALRTDIIYAANLHLSGQNGKIR
ncbi:hypothetical protein [Magnetofaba australis]|uniref:Uncharacterized protein n=1 Tax=Magnetofaba australis IT-1 TaxID=1434232 RepID=A0A1Y2K3I4_9PROT|nr:hypothetical protein [Magnetofaba australis]OSM02186.1 hypothetical protein MAIT1_02289 [Magnetofaba australis IT-1]